jgi:hypothetical protein
MEKLKAEIKRVGRECGRAGNVFVIRGLIFDLTEAVHALAEKMEREDCIDCGSRKGEFTLAAPQFAPVGSEAGAALTTDQASTLQAADINAGGV